MRPDGHRYRALEVADVLAPFPAVVLLPEVEQRERARAERLALVGEDVDKRDVLRVIARACVQDCINELAMGDRVRSVYARIKARSKYSLVDEAARPELEVTAVRERTLPDTGSRGAIRVLVDRNDSVVRNDRLRVIGLRRTLSRRYSAKSDPFN